MANKKFTDLDLVAAWGRHRGNISAVAKELDVTRRAVRVRKELLPPQLFTTNLDEFRQQRSDLLAEIQRIAMTHIMDANKLKSASLQQLITLMAIAYDKERLENNLSTENIAHAHYEGLDADDKSALKELIKQRTQKALAASREEEDDV